MSGPDDHGFHPRASAVAAPPDDEDTSPCRREGSVNDDRDWTHGESIRLTAADYLPVDAPHIERARQEEEGEMVDVGSEALAFAEATRTTIVKLRRERDDALCDVARLERLLDEACDAMAEKDTYIKELRGAERAHAGTGR